MTFIKHDSLDKLEAKMKIFTLIIISLFTLTCVSAIGNSIPIQIQTTNGSGNIETGTYEFTINISNSSTCSPVLYSNISTLTTDNRGIVSYDIMVSLDFSEQYYLCFYRDGVSKLNKTIGTNPYAFRANVSDYHNPLNNITAPYFIGDGSQLTGIAGGGDIDEVTTVGAYLSGGSDSGVVNLLFNETKLNLTIDLMDSDTTYTNGTGLSLIGTVFSITSSYLEGLFLELSGGTMTGDLNMGDNNIDNIDTINITNNTYIHNLRSYNENSINVQPTGDDDDFFSFKTIADRPTIKREGGKFIYFESSNVYDVGVSFRKDDTYSGTLAYAKDDNIFKLLGKESPIAVVPNSEYLNYILFETYNHQPQISVFNGTILKINDSLEVIGDGNFTGDVTADVFYGDVKIDTINGQTYQYLQDWIDTTQSAGKVSGGAFTSNGDGTVNISTGAGFIKTSDSATANTILFDWDTNISVSLTDNSTNYIYVDYNSGSPMVKSSTSKVNNRDKILLGKIFREGTVLHIYEAGMLIAEATKNTLGRFTSIDGEFTRASGLILSETGTLNLAMTSGVAWGGLTMVNIDAFNSSIDTFEYYYYNSANWIEDNSNQISNTYYNDPTSGLVELTTNRYGVHWVYVDNDGHLMVVYGQGDYTLALATASQPPSSLPEHITDFGELIGRIILQKGDSIFTNVDIPSEFVFTSTGATDYNSLSNTPTSLTDFIDDLGDRGYTNNLNFTNGANYWNDTYATFNKTYADTLYADISVVDTTDGNASSICADGEFLNGDGTCDAGFLDADGSDADTTYTNGTGLSLVGTVFSLIGTIFSGSWNDLTDVPSGFSDGIDNDTASGLTHLTNFTDDLGDRGYTHLGNFTDDIGVSADWDEIDDITADGITDTQLEYNTGQHLTTTSNPTFNNATITNCIIFGNGAELCGI